MTCFVILMNFSIIELKIKEAILYISYVLKHYGEVYSFLKPAERNISGLPKFKYLLFSNLYHTSWVTKRKVVIMMKEENVEDEVSHHQLRGLEKTEVTVCLFL